MNFKRIIIGPFLATVFVVVFVYAISGMQSFTESFKNKYFTASVADAISENKIIIPGNIARPIIEINAGSAISVETDLQGEDNIVFEKKSEEKLPIASLTKLMMAMLVLDNYNLSDMQVVGKMADAQSTMEVDLKLGDKMSVRNLLSMALIASSNKAAYALSEIMGVEKFVGLMNQKARELQLENTFFIEPTGISPGNVSTAKDLVKLAKNILKNYPQITWVTRTKELNIEGFGKIVNTDQLLAEVPGVICGKTGFTEEAKGCLLLVVKDEAKESYSINVILGADDRFSEMKKLINEWTY